MPNFAISRGMCDCKNAWRSGFFGFSSAVFCGPCEKGFKTSLSAIRKVGAIDFLRQKSASELRNMRGSRETCIVRVYGCHIIAFEFAKFAAKCASRIVLIRAFLAAL